MSNVNPPTLSSTTTVELMQASKFLSVPVLLSLEEMEALLKDLGSFYIYMTSCIVKKDNEGVTHHQFLEVYKNYVEALKNGVNPAEKEYRHLLSTVFTYQPDHLYAVPVSENESVVRVLKPVVQLQPHRLDYSKADGKFRSMSYGMDSISWGVQFSYPQLYKDLSTQEIENVKESSEFPNTELFHKLQYWVRHHTVPTPFIVEEKQINSPVRLGKECFSWINRHPHLVQKGISVKTPKP